MESKKEINPVLSTENLELMFIHECKGLEKQYVDEYYVNGFNKVQAAMSVRPDISYGTASQWASNIMERPTVRSYMRLKQEVLTRETGVNHIRILNELLSFAYSDLTAYIGLTLEELRALPPGVRRCIQSIDVNEKSYLSPVTKGVVKEISTKIKLVSKMAALDSISKHIDFHNADNVSKSGAVDLTKASNEQLNVVLELIQGQKDSE